MTRPLRSMRPWFFSALALACLLAACRPQTTAPAEDFSQAPAPKSAITPEPSPTPAAPKVRYSDPLTTDALHQNMGRPGVVRLSWSTQSELNSFAYYMMRAKDPKGPFEPANKEPIQAAGISSTERNYEFLDTSVRIGEVYWYYPRQVDLDGTKKDITEWTLKKVVDRLNLNAATSGTMAK